VKTLLLLRHGKSSWENDELADHDRPLKKRGRAATQLIGQRLKDEELVPELILSSTAARAKETANLVAEVMHYRGPVELEQELYLAEPDVILERIKRIQNVGRLMLVGHNPGLERLIERLTGREERFPTAALAAIRINAAAWDSVPSAGSAELVELWRPRKLER
jgi:phosphohistidine phosphatase